MGLDLERVLFKRKMFGRELARERIEEAIAMVYGTSMNALADALIDSVKNRRVFWALVISEAILRKPSLIYGLSLEFLRRGGYEASKTLFVSEEILDHLNTLGRGRGKIDEDYIDAFMECAKYNCHASYDIKRCREHYISSLLPISETSAKLLSAMSPLAFTPSNIEMKRRMGDEKFVILWPYIAVLGGDPRQISWYLVESEIRSSPVDMPSDVKSLKGLALKNGAVFIATTSEGKDHAYMSYVDGRMIAVRGRRVCVDNSYGIHVLGSGDGDLRVSQYDNRGVMVYEKTLSTSAQDAKSVSCLPIPWDGVMFSLVRKKSTTLIMSRRGLVHEHTVNTAIERILTLPLGVVIGFTRDSIVVMWFVPSENRVEVVEERVPYALPYTISDVMAVPHLGIVAVTGSSLSCVNSVGTIRRENLYRWDKTPKTVSVATWPTFSILLLFDKQDHIEKMFLLREGNVRTIETDLFMRGFAKGFAYNRSTICLLSDASIRCFSPIFLKIVADSGKKPLTDIEYVRDLLALYEKSSSNKEIAEVLHTGSASLDDGFMDSYLHKMSLILESARLKFEMLDVERLITRAINLNVPLELLGFLLRELMDKVDKVHEAIKSTLPQIANKIARQDRGVTLNSDAMISIHEAYSALSDIGNLDKISPACLIRHCEKIRQGLESIGLEETSIASVLEREIVKNLAPKLFQLAEGDANEAVHYLALKYLKDFGVDFALVRSRLNEIKFGAREIRLVGYEEAVESRIRIALAEGNISKIDSILKYSQEILNDIRHTLNRYGASPCVSDILQIALGNVSRCLRSEADLSRCKAMLEESKACFEKLSGLYSEVLSTVSSTNYLKGDDVLKLFADSQTCPERVRRAEQILSRIKKMKVIIDKVELLIRDLDSMRIKPTAVTLIREKVKSYISSLDVDAAAKELSTLERYHSVSKEFNEIYSKLELLADMPIFRDAKDALNSIVREFENLGAEDIESFRGRIGRLMEIDIEEVKKSMDSIHEKLTYFKAPRQLLSDILIEFIRRTFSLGVAESPIVYLRALDARLSELRSRVDAFTQALEKLKSALGGFDREGRILSEVYETEKSSCITMFTSVAGLPSKLDSIASEIARRTSKARELGDRLQQVYDQFRMLEPEFREALQKLFISLISKEDERSINAIDRALSKFNDIVKDINLLEFNENLKMTKQVSATLKSANAKTLVNNIISGSLRKVSEGDLKEAWNRLWFAYSVYGELVYKNIDSLIFELENAGLGVINYLRIDENAYRESTKKVLADIIGLNEVKDFLRKCPRCVVKLLNVSKDVKLAIKVLKFANRIESDIEKLCKILDMITFNDVKQCLVEVLTAVGREVIGAGTDTKEEKLALAYTTLMSYVKDVARDIVSCETIPRELGIPRRIYNEFCLSTSIEESIGNLALACLEKSSHECRVAVELLGGRYVNQLIELVGEIAALLGIDDVGRSALYKLIKQKIADSIVREGLRSFEGIEKEMKEIKSIREGLERNAAVVRILRGLPSEQKETLRGDLSTLLRVVGLYMDRVSKGRITLEEGSLELHMDGEIEDGKESGLKLRVCSRLPVPITLRGASIDFVVVNYSISLTNLRHVVLPRKCSEVIDIRVPKLMFSSAILHYGKEVASKVRLEFTMFGLQESDVDVYESYINIPVRYYGPMGELVKILEDLSTGLKTRKIGVEIKTEKLGEIMLGVGGNNIVVLGTRGEEKVALKVPKFYTSYRYTSADYTRDCEELANKCVEATRRCSNKSINPVLDIRLDPLFAMEKYVEGVTLRRLLSEKRVLSISDAAAIAKRIGEGVKCLHEHGVYHNDIRPENVIVKRVGDRVEDVYVIDSCIDGVWNCLRRAGLCGDPVVGKPRILVDPRRLHPDLVKLVERSYGDPTTHMMIDVFQLGLLLSEMLLGYNPMDVVKSVEELNEVIAEIPLALRDIVSKALQPTKSRVTLNEFITYIENIKLR